MGKGGYLYGMKVVLLILTLSTAGILRCQPPNNYYSSTNNLSGNQLKLALNSIIKGHIEYPYTSSLTDVWDILKESDKDTLNNANVILFYTGWSVNAAQEYNNGNGWTREHVWAKSHGQFGNELGAGTDAHHIRPSDGTVNSARSNLDFDIGGSIYVDNDGETSNKKDEDSWEPRDEVKGDVARMLYYMAVRYEGEGTEPDLELVDEVNSFYLNEPGKGYHGKFSTLLEWHKEDPVDIFERNRNEVIYDYQGNRNPFVDYPDFVDLIWGTVSSSVSNLDTESLKIFPNPAQDLITINHTDCDEITVHSLLGQNLLTFKGPPGRVNVSILSSGVYLLQVIKGKKVWVGRFVKS